MFVFVVVYDLYTADYDLHFIIFFLILFLVMILVSCFHKSVLFYFVYFEELLTLEYLLLKIEVWSQSVGVARWVRPGMGV